MWFARVASIAAVVALTASCGGDEGAPLSAEEFRDRAEAICREIEETDVRPPSDVSDLDRYADEFTAVIEASASDMHDLEPPEEFQDRWQEYLALLDDAYRGSTRSPMRSKARAPKRSRDSAGSSTPISKSWSAGGMRSSGSSDSTSASTRERLGTPPNQTSLLPSSPRRVPSATSSQGW
jgi:hypothetical protein